MATSITYKGSELASFSNNTKTLKTAGKYLEGDITISASTVLGTTTVIPSETTQTISPASGQEGLSSVTVNGITNTYVGSGVPTGSLTVAGPTVTASAGYYASDVTATIPEAVPTTTIVNLSNNDPRVLNVSDSGLITILAGDSSGSASYYPYMDGSAGYVKTNSAIRISVASKTSTYQLPTLPAQSFTPSSTTQTVVSTGKYMLGDITVQPIPSKYIVPTGVTTITSNGTHNVTSFASASVNVQPNLEAKSFTPSETSTTITAGSGYDGLSSVTVAGITNTYVGSGIAKNPTITVSGPSVTIPAGYYSSQQTKTVASGSVSTPSTTITANPTVSVSSSGLITASVTGSSNVAPSVSAGYISSGTAGTISVTGSTTLQLTTQGSTTVTPSTTAQTVNVTGKYMTGNVTVNPIPSQYIVPSGTYTISSVDSTNTFNVTNYASAEVTITDADSIAY